MSRKGEDMHGHRPDPLPLCLVGCGGMGRRHLAGYAALARAGLARFELVGVTDLRPENARALAAEAEGLLGRRPEVYETAEDAVAGGRVAALDLVTDPASHAEIAIPALEAGIPVLCEKPLGLTVRACRAMVEATERGGTVLATAENYRRGGQNRLAKAALEAGLLGRVHLMVQLMVGGSDEVMITPWRHRKESGAIGLDMGVHLADIVEFLLGEVDTVFGRGLIAEPVRRGATGEQITATGEDSLLAQLRTARGVEVQLAYLPSGPGRRYVQRTVHGSAGSLVIPPDRSDGLLELHRGEEILRGSEIRRAIGPAAELDTVTKGLLGVEGTGDGAPFAEVDAAYLGVEIADFVSAVLDGHAPEVDGAGGMRAVALVLAIIESGLLGRSVEVPEILDGSLHGYQDDLDLAAGLISATERSATKEVLP